MSTFKSTLEKITSEIFEPNITCEQVRKIIVIHLEGCNVKDKEKMLIAISTLTTIYQIQKYTCNALLKFEGLSMTQLDKCSDGHPVKTPDLDKQIIVKKRMS